MRDHAQRYPAGMLIAAHARVTIPAMNFGDVFPKVMRKSIAALAYASLLVGVYFILRGPGGILGLVPLLVVATFVFGFIPTVTYGAAIYTLYVTEPRFPFVAVLVASFLPGLIWVWVTQPELNRLLWLSVGPMLAVILHLLMRYSLRFDDERSN